MDYKRDKAFKRYQLERKANRRFKNELREVEEPEMAQFYSEYSKGKRTRNETRSFDNGYGGIGYHTVTITREVYIRG